MFSFNVTSLVLFAIILVVAIFLLVAVGLFWQKHRRLKPSVLSRYQGNPIISPNVKHDWESQGTFNPGAIEDDDGNIHLLYRAVGSDGVSRVGYASSKDGFHFGEGAAYPVFAMPNPRSKALYGLRRHDFVLYPSGGSWGGAEDPRLVRFDGRVYLTFNAFDGWDFVRIGVASVAEKDFFAKRWTWSKPLFVSSPNEINKNWVLFPEKIGGRFAILHTVSPDVVVDYVDRLEDLATGQRVIKSRFSHSEPQAGWDSFRRGVGPPPLKTEKGWLVLYHAISKKEPGRYKLGALLLDLNDPRKVIAKAPEPFLAPDRWYENDFKPGVVYACGAVIKDGTLFVYYGGGDKYVCVATAPLKKIFKMLKPV
ncbi:MAG: hypothetical protein HYV67_03625 [Candidatus Taylorbacteria bacterium]|nr:hypothetical protein [Candidatus Taylorbacteria bacterium]